MSTIGARMKHAAGRAALGVALVLAMAGVTQAGPLNLKMSLPDIATDYMKFSYVAAGGAFSAQSTMDSTFIYKPTNTAINNGVFTLSATVSNSQQLQLGGTVNISGQFGAYNGTLFTGSLTDFGYNPVSGTFEFAVDPIADPLGLGPHAGVVLQGHLPGLDFKSDFGRGPDTGFYDVTADTAHVPEPVSSSLLALGVLGLGLVRRRRD